MPPFEPLLGSGLFELGSGLLELPSSTASIAALRRAADDKLRVPEMLRLAMEKDRPRSRSNGMSDSNFNSAILTNLAGSAAVNSSMTNVVDRLLDEIFTSPV